MADTHSGHRERLRQKAREDLEAFEPHEVLELLLFYVIPRRNTNPDGHRLIDTFGSAAKALDAPPEELRQVPGIGERAAQWISCVGKLVAAYRELTCWERPMLANVRLAREFLEKHFGGDCPEGVWTLCLSAEGRLLAARPFADRGKWAEEGAVSRAVEDSMRLHAHSLLLLQICRGEARPTAYDLRHTRRFARTLHAMDVYLLDHLLFNGQEMYSMFAHADVEELGPRSQSHSPLGEHYLDGL